VGLDQEEEAAERERCIERKQETEQIVSGFGSGRVGICIVYRVDLEDQPLCSDLKNPLL
jgi:hypothetical protein